MKWSIQQLNKMPKFPFSFHLTFDFQDDIVNIEDILNIKEVVVDGKIDRIDEVTFRFSYHMVAPLVLQCALTLNPVDYVIEKDYDEIYSKIEQDEYFLIEKNTIDMREIIWTNILIEKPINVTLPNAYEILQERGVVLDDCVSLDEDEEVLYYDDGLEDDQDAQQNNPQPIKKNEN